MIDWFVFLTPLLLLPIALFFFFVGCSLIFTAAPIDDGSQIAIVRFHISFYLVPERVGNEFEFNIYNQSVPIHTVISKVKVQESQDGKVSEASHSFTCFLPPGMANLTCRVFDHTVPLPSNLPLVDENAACQDNFGVDNEYLLVFNAGASDDQMVPNDVFDTCTVVPLSQ